MMWNELGDFWSIYAGVYVVVLITEESRKEKHICSNTGK